MTTEATPAAAAETPAHTQSSTAESQVNPGPALNIPAPEAATQDNQPPAAATQDTGTPEPQEGKPEGTGEDESRKKAKQQSVSDRIAKYAAERNEWRMRAIAAEAEAQRLRTPLQPPGPHATQDEVDRFNVRSAVREQRAEEVASEAVQAAEAAAAARAATIQAKAEAVADRMPNLMQQLQALPTLSEACVEFMASSDKGAEVGFFLTQNPAEAARISSLHPYHQGIELARIEGRLTAAPQLRRNTTAPPPPPRMPGAPSAAAKDPGDMSQAEYNAWYKSRQKKA